MKPITANTEYIAACGLYCGACRKFLTEKCAGCKGNEKTTWCKIRKCCEEKGFQTCAECQIAATDCPNHSTFTSKLFSFLFRSDRPACIQYIKENGPQAFAEEMTRRKCQTMKK